jgi:hypothetical protein
MSEVPKRAFGDAASDKARSGTAVCKSRIELLSVNLTINGRRVVLEVDRVACVTYRSPRRLNS